MKRAEQGLKFSKWSEGKQAELSKSFKYFDYNIYFHLSLSLETVASALASSSESK
jgi:hypothetical protein